MKKDDKLVQEITSREVDFAKWYTDIVRKAELIDYSSVRGCMCAAPLWLCHLGEHSEDSGRKIQGARDMKTSCMPLFIPESLLQKEKDHVEGFAPEVAWVTYGRQRASWPSACACAPPRRRCSASTMPTSSTPTATCPSSTTSGASVVRWEKTTRPFLRTAEFLWQEGHTMHATGRGGHRGDRAHAGRLCRLCARAACHAGDARAARPTRKSSPAPRPPTPSRP